MNRNTDQNVTAIAANLAALQCLLDEATARCREANECIKQGERNGAIGSINGLDCILDDAKALYVAALALHRRAW